MNIKKIVNCENKAPKIIFWVKNQPNLFSFSKCFQSEVVAFKTNQLKLCLSPQKFIVSKWYNSDCIKSIQY